MAKIAQIALELMKIVCVFFMVFMAQKYFGIEVILHWIVRSQRTCLKQKAEIHYAKHTHTTYKEQWENGLFNWNIYIKFDCLH